MTSILKPLKNSEKNITFKERQKERRDIMAVKFNSILDPRGGRKGK